MALGNISEQLIVYFLYTEYSAAIEKADKTVLYVC